MSPCLVVRYLLLFTGLLAENLTMRSLFTRKQDCHTEHSCARLIWLQLPREYINCLVTMLYGSHAGVVVANPFCLKYGKESRLHTTKYYFLAYATQSASLQDAKVF